MGGGPRSVLAVIFERGSDSTVVIDQILRAGEGKTLTSVLPAYLNGLAGNGVHVVTVNDYLAKRDSEWMGRVHRFLGLTVGCILAQMPPEQRKEQYACDITYGTNNEFGF